MGTVIDWKKDQDVTKEVFRKTQKSKTGKKRIIVKTQPCESFFNIFESKKMPEAT